MGGGGGGREGRGSGRSGPSAFGGRGRSTARPRQLRSPRISLEDLCAETRGERGGGSVESRSTAHVLGTTGHRRPRRRQLPAPHPHTPTRSPELRALPSAGKKGRPLVAAPLEYGTRTAPMRAQTTARASVPASLSRRGNTQSAAARPTAEGRGPRRGQEGARGAARTTRRAGRRGACFRGPPNARTLHTMLLSMGSGLVDGRGRAADRGSAAPRCAGRRQRRAGPAAPGRPPPRPQLRRPRRSPPARGALPVAVGPCLADAPGRPVRPVHAPVRRASIAPRRASRRARG